jgi:hypothetical protein
VRNIGITDSVEGGSVSIVHDSMCGATCECSSCIQRNPTTWFVRIGFAIWVNILLCAPQTLYGQWTWLDGARAHPEFRGTVPRKSDVVFSSRSGRADALEVIRAYGANRVEWCYSDAEEFIQQIRGAIEWFGGAINPTLRPQSDSGYALDIEGKPIVAPWMTHWGSPWISTTSNDSRQALFNKSKRFIERGARSIQVDDPLMQLATVRWGGDFSSATLQGFSEYLRNNPEKMRLTGLTAYKEEPFDYREYLASQYRINTLADYLRQYARLPSTPIWASYIKSTVRDFYVWYRSQLDYEASQRFPISMNLVGLSRPDETRAYFFLSEFADYAISETPISDPVDMVIRAATMRALGIGHVASLLPRSREENRRAIAFLYSIGVQPLVPWDVYIGTGPDRKPKRFYGEPKDYADMYSFVRANRELFDGFETAAVVGIVIPVHKYREKETVSLVRRLLYSNVPLAFVLVGGTDREFSLDVDRVMSFRTLLTVNSLGDFSEKDRKMLQSSKLQLVSATQLSSDDVQALSPFHSSSGRLIPRASTYKKDVLVIHILGREKDPGSEDASESCRQAVGLKADSLTGMKIIRARWITSSGEVKIQKGAKSEGPLFEVESCHQWGLLKLTIRKDLDPKK